VNIPPILEQTPQFDLPEPVQPRIYGGWIALVVMFGMMITLQLVQYFDRGDPTHPKSYAEQITQLKLAYDLKSMPMLKDSKAAPLEETLDQILKKVQPDIPTQTKAAKITVAIQGEKRDPVSKVALAKLASSDKPEDRVWAEIYREGPLSKARAAALESKLKASEFLDKLAIRHAWTRAGEANRIRIGSPAGMTFKVVAISILALALLAGCIVLIGFVIAKIAGLLPSRGFPLEKIGHADADRLAARCAQFVGIFLFVQFAASLIFSYLPVDKGFATVIMTGTIMFAFWKLSERPIAGGSFPLNRLGLRKGDLGSHVVWGVGTAIANIPIVLATALISNWIFSGLPNAEHPATTQLQNGLSPLGIACTIFAASIAAPLMEELMFRGTLLPAMAKSWSRPVLAILVQGLIFATIHPTGIPAWLPLASIGASSGFLSRQTGSLVPSMIMHAIHNLGTLLIVVAISG
jgi:membrane protease YdiL (CAAX protease family)